MLNHHARVLPTWNCFENVEKPLLLSLFAGAYMQKACMVPVENGLNPLKFIKIPSAFAMLFQNE